MQPNPAFVGLPKEFWANIRTISQEVGYTQRRTPKKGVKGQPGPIKVPTLAEAAAALESINLTAKHLVGQDAKPTDLGKQVIGYYDYRADTLNRVVEPLLLNAGQATELFDQLQSKLGAQGVVPMNKQSAEKRNPAYFTGMINMLIEYNLKGLPCNYNPQELTTVTRNRTPFRTLARRIDGAFPGPVDPLAVWEIKEYYYTTTFGSRVADGVYETLLDGMELEELDAALRELSKVEDRANHIQHLLMVDAHFTWWIKGRSYLCRIIDMLHMGYVDEVLFGKEIVTRLPLIVKAWVKAYRERGTVGHVN
jgi:hypothetical protein